MQQNFMALYSDQSKGHVATDELLMQQNMLLCYFTIPYSLHSHTHTHIHTLLHAHRVGNN